MPTYEYACDECGHEFEEFQSITARPLRKCPECGRRSLQRLIGRGGGIIFKGAGFYETDYRSESYKKAAEAEKKAATGDGKKTDSSSKSDTGGKNAAGGESKSPTKAKSKAKKPSTSGS
ncbi:MAG: zinc ribbon domain-containing protein [Planctomycetota bacterium]|nr:MAG: zinc ribbon domain-containing protein [Planctomycetota bacterium]